jgi:hypothetical protein
MSRERVILRGKIFITGEKWNSEKGSFFSQYWITCDRPHRARMKTKVMTIEFL